MKKFPEEFQKFGRTYKQVTRNQHKIAIYEIFEGGISLGFEVVRIVVKQPDNYCPEEYESYPSNEQFGNLGFAIANFGSREKAIARAYQILNELTIKKNENVQAFGQKHPAEAQRQKRSATVLNRVRKVKQ